MQMLEQRQHLLLAYFKTMGVDPAGNRTRASRTIDYIYLDEFENGKNSNPLQRVGLWRVEALVYTIEI